MFLRASLNMIYFNFSFIVENRIVPYSPHLFEDKLRFDAASTWAQGIVSKTLTKAFLDVLWPL